MTTAEERAIEQNRRDTAMINEAFTYHAPTDAQQIALVEVRGQAAQLARCIVEHVPPCADRSAALRKLRECVMTANAAIVLDGKV